MLGQPGQSNGRLGQEFEGYCFFLSCRSLDEPTSSSTAEIQEQKHTQSRVQAERPRMRWAMLSAPAAPCTLTFDNSPSTPHLQRGPAQLIQPWMSLPGDVSAQTALPEQGAACSAAHQSIPANARTHPSPCREGLIYLKQMQNNNKNN